MTDENTFCAEEGAGIDTLRKCYRDLQIETLEELDKLREEHEAGKIDQATLIKRLQETVGELFDAMGW